MKKHSNKEDNSIMKELSSTIIFTEKSDIIFNETYLDNKSAYTFLYLSSIFHDNIEELKEHLKLQFHHESKYNIPKEEYLSTKDDYFEKNFNELNLYEENKVEQKSKFLKPIKAEKEEIQNLFTSSFYIALITSIMQFSLIYAIKKENLDNNHFCEVNMKSKIIKYLLIFCLIFKTYIEFINGKKIVVYGIYNGYLYRTFIKRILSILMGLIQIIINYFIYIVFIKIILRAESNIKSIEIFCVFIVISQFDNWIGDFYLIICNKFNKYTRGYFKQIFLVNNRKRCKIKLFEAILYLLFICALIIPFFKCGSDKYFL